MPAHTQPIPDNTVIVLEHDRHISPMRGDCWLSYVVRTDDHWSMIRCHIELGFTEVGPTFDSFCEAKRAFDAGAIRWEGRK